jgi:uncharacterized metal-binding protein
MKMNNYAVVWIDARTRSPILVRDGVTLDCAVKTIEQRRAGPLVTQADVRRRLAHDAQGWHEIRAVERGE